MKILAVLILIWATTASAKDLHVEWKNPIYNTFPDSCGADSTYRISQFLGTDLYGVRFDTMDTLYFGRVPGSVGQQQGVTLSIDSTVTMGAVWAYSVNGYGPSCRLASAVWVLPNLPPPPPDTTNGGLLGSYYASASGDTTQWGAPVLVRRDSTLDFAWGAGPPAPSVPVDNFRARWQGYVTVPTAGFWYFYLDTDDGSRFWLDDYWLLSWWGYGAEQEQSVGIDLAAGKHKVRVDYLAADGNATARLRWSGPGQAKGAIPAWALSH